MTQKNIVYGNITATGDVHIGDITYNIQENFQHSILFLRIEAQEGGLYSAQLSLKSRHAGKAKLPATGLPLLHENIPLQLKPQLFEQINLFQEFRRLGEANYRDISSQFTHLNPWSEEQLTQELFDAFFQGDILQVCRDFVDLLEKRKIEELILAISSPDTQVLNLPFEMLIPRFFPSKLGVVRQSLAVNHFGLVRSLETDLGSFDMQGKTASAAPLKMLFVTALPENLDEKSKMLEIEEEQKRLIDAIGTFEATGGKPKIVIEFLDTASLAEINEALKKHQHDILHISGHGSYKKDVKRGVLHLEDEEGNHLEVSGGTLGETLRQHQCVKLLILSACETAVTGDGVVEELAAYGLPAIVAMRFAVTDEGAKKFTTALYAALSKGETLTLALAQARENLWQYLQAQIKLDPQRAHLAEWYTPVVYLNQYSAALVDSQLTYIYPEDFYPRSDFFKTKNTRLIGSGFIGRKRYLNQLRRSFGKGQHVVLHGLGGLGKTTLAEAFAHNYDNRSHEVLIFRNGAQISEQYILNTILTRFAKKLPEHIAEQLQELLEGKDADPVQKLQALLANVLQDRKSILIFDNFEDVQQDLEGVQERAIGSASLAGFMQCFCANTPPNCHLLFTTRYVISDLAAQVRHLGLDKLSYAESYRLSNFSPTLRAIPLRERQDVFKRLDGHPRAYEFLEAILKKDQHTDWSTLAASVGQVEAQVWENLLLEKIYARLTVAEQRLLQMAAVCFTRTPLGALVEISQQEEVLLLPLLQSLFEWSLCVWDAEGKLFEVHRLTREWMLKKMVDGEALKKWAFEAGTFFRAQRTVGDGELAKDYFERAEAWEEFADVSFTLQSYYQLIGFYQKALEINQKVADKNIDNQSNAHAFNEIGLILKLFGKIDEALGFYQKSLAIQQQIGNRQGEGATLNNLATAAHAKGDYDSALHYLEQSLAIRQQIGDRQGEGTTLNNISQIYHDKGDYDSALRYLEQSLAIRQQIGDRKGEGATLNNLATTAHAKGDYDSALRYLEQSLAIQQQIGDRQGEGATLNNISQIHKVRGDYDSALRYLEQSLAIHQQIGDRQGEGSTLNNIGQIYSAKGDYNSALRYLEQSLAIRQQIGYRLGIGETLHNIGAIAFGKDDLEGAVLYFFKAYQIFQQIGSPNLKVTVDYLGAIIERIGEAKFQEILSKMQ